MLWLKKHVFGKNGKSVNASEVYSKIPFFCDTENCGAEMVIVSMGEKTAHFRSKSKSDHKFAACIRNDIDFNTDKYNKELFKLDNFKNRILSNSEKVNFTYEDDFWRVYNHHKKLEKAYLSIMLIAAEWKSAEANSDYIAECTVTKSSQHTYIALN